MNVANYTRITPRNNLVVVETEFDPGVTRSGLITGVRKEKRSNAGTVVAVGPGRLTEDGVRVRPELTIGDRVRFQHQDGIDLESGGVWYRIIDASKILCIVG